MSITIGSSESDHTLCSGLWSLMWRESVDLRCLSLCQYHPACYTENWGEAIFPIDDSGHVKSSNSDVCCRNLMKSDFDFDSDKRHECSSDYGKISPLHYSSRFSTESAVVRITFCCNTNTHYGSFESVKNQICFQIQFQHLGEGGEEKETEQSPALCLLSSEGNFSE